MTLGRLVDGLQERGVEVTVVAPSRRDRKREQTRAADLVVVPGLPIPRYPELRFGLPAGRRLRRIWRENRPDWVHIATEGPLGWSALRAAEHLQLTLVSSFHTNFHTYGRHYGYGLLRAPVLSWMRHFHNRTLRTFAPSSDLMELLETDGFRNLRLFARGVDTRLFGPHRRDAELRRSWGAGPDTPVALYVGRLAGEKNLGLVLEAARKMRVRHPDLKLVLVGDGPERKRAEKAFPEACFAGMRTGTDLAAHYASADCFLFASTTETFGNVVTEAMASALPVLAYDYAAPGRFIKHRENGWRVPFDQPAAFLEAATELAGHHADWPAMGQRARETILPHSWEAVVGEYLSEIQLLLNPHPALST